MMRWIAALGAAMCLTVVITATTSVVFVDVTDEAGLRFRHTSGAVGQKYMPETLGAGGVWLDVDDDGWQDIVLVNSTTWPGQSTSGTHAMLYRNNGNGTFDDISSGSGVDIPLYGLGGAAGDFDNDGRTDLYLTALGQNRLLRGQGDGTFVDVTDTSGTGDPGFSTSALWFDYDNDGYLDLFVTNYVEWTPEIDLYCTLDGETKSYCTPESYQGQSSTLYRNLGNGTFENVSMPAGVSNPSAKALSASMFDVDSDGWMDLFVTNDTQPNQLFRNQGDGTFEDIAVVSGVAFSEAGIARAGMGVDAADYDGSGHPSLIIGNFSNEMMALYHNEGNGLFIDEAPRSELGRATLLTLTFGCFFFDYDLDGWLDVFAANGHVADDVEQVQSRVTHAQRPQLFHNAGRGRFEEIVEQAGNALQQPMVARGAAYADFDNDGDLDILITSNGGAPRLLRNDGGNTNNLLRVKTVGTESNRDGIGARVEVTTGGQRRWQMVKTGSSYASQSEVPLTFGLGDQMSVELMRVVWPSGQVDEVTGIAANEFLVVEEGRGTVSSTAIIRD
jgi:hypothetical protein